MLDDCVNMQIPRSLAGSESIHPKRPLTEISFFTSRTPAIIHPSHRLRSCGTLSSEMQRIDMRSAPAPPKFTAFRKSVVLLHFRSRLISSNPVSD
jgi:hypothetical protein